MPKDGTQTFLAFHENGTQLTFGTDETNMIDIDEMRLKHAAESVEVVEVDETEAEVTVERGTCPLRSLLTEARLDEYYQVLVDEGYDDVDFLRSMDEARADEMARLTRMKPGHLMKFNSFVRRSLGDFE